VLYELCYCLERREERKEKKEGEREGGEKEGRKEGWKERRMGGREAKKKEGEGGREKRKGEKFKFKISGFDPFVGITHRLKELQSCEKSRKLHVNPLFFRENN
jgi:hypothetical protein